MLHTSIDMIGYLLTVCWLYMVLTVSGQSYPEECKVMQNVSNIIDHQDRVSMICKPNSQCTGFDCSGNYTYKGLYSALDNVTEGFCFGMALHPCKPDEAHFYVEIPKKNTDFNQTLHSTDIVQLNDVRYQSSGIYQADGFVNVSTFQPGGNSRKYIDIAMNFCMRIIVGRGPFKISHWPEDFKFIMVPKGRYYLPSCKSGNAIDPAPACHYYSAPRTTPSPPGVSPKPTKSPDQQEIPISKNGNKPIPCNYASIAVTECGTHQACDQELSICKCITGYEVDTNGYACKPSNESVFDFGPYYVSESSQQKSIAMIVGSATSALIVVVLLLGIVVYKYRKYRARYGQHEVLMNNDDDDQYDVEPIDINT